MNSLYIAYELTKKQSYYYKKESQKNPFEFGVLNAKMKLLEIIKIKPLFHDNLSINHSQYKPNNILLWSKVMDESDF